MTLNFKKIFMKSLKIIRAFLEVNNRIFVDALTKVDDSLRDTRIEV